MRCSQCLMEFKTRVLNRRVATLHSDLLYHNTYVQHICSITHQCRFVSLGRRLMFEWLLPLPSTWAENSTISVAASIFCVGGFMWGQIFNRRTCWLFCNVSYFHNSLDFIDSINILCIQLIHTKLLLSSWCKLDVAQHIFLLQTVLKTYDNDCILSVLCTCNAMIMMMRTTMTI